MTLGTLEEASSGVLGEVVRTASSPQTETQTRLENQDQRAKDSSVRNNLLVVVGGNNDELDLLRRKLAQADSQLPQQMLQLKNSRDILPELKAQLNRLAETKSGFKVNNLGILFLDKSRKIAGMVQNHLKELLDGPGKDIRNFFLATQDIVNPLTLTAQSVEKLKELKVGISEFFQNNAFFNSLANFLSQRGASWPPESEDDLMLRPVSAGDVLDDYKPEMTSRIIFNPLDMKSGKSPVAKEFLPFLNKIFNLQTT